jgi:hypothetical protein
MKKIPLLFITILSFQFFPPFVRQAFSQGGVWTWIHGDSIPNQSGNFGTKGISDPTNTPPALYEAADWKDKQGNFWVYGGSSNNTSYNALWKYNPATNEWTWINGSSSGGQSVSYGIQGIPSPTNTPGSRSFGCFSWTDTTGNLWLMGGSHFSQMKNDLWKYDITTNEWTWISGTSIGDSPGAHGVKGIPSILNYPGARSETASSWTDEFNNLWMFGGYGYDDAGQSGGLDDLMSYNISTNEWTWMHGSNSVISSVASYGVKGISDPSNNPGPRYSFTKWKDVTGRFWIMGGTTAFGSLNDLWNYNPSTNEWTWMNGSSAPFDSGQYQNQCVYDAVSNPAARTEHRAATTDNCGRFWLFGGYYLKNDLWIYDPVLSKWKWVRGTFPLIQPFNYGSINIPSYTNNPPSRCGGLAWCGNDNKIYIFGGYETGWYNDLWVFQPDTNCVSNYCSIPTAIFNASNNICSGSCTSFQNLSVAATSYQWFFPGASPDTSSDVNPSNICYNTTGTFDVTLVAINSNGADTLTLSNYITVFPQPSPQSITQNFDTLFAIPGSASYQWYYNGNTIAGATDYFYIAGTSGDYNVIATDTNGCEVEAVINNVLASTQFVIGNWQLAIVPNPVSETLTATSYPPVVTAKEISIFNMLGEKILLDVDLESMTVNCRPLQPGIYFLEIISSPPSGAGGPFRTKFLKH